MYVTWVLGFKPAYNIISFSLTCKEYLWKRKIRVCEVCEVVYWRLFHLMWHVLSFFLNSIKCLYLCTLWIIKLFYNWRGKLCNDSYFSNNEWRGTITTSSLFHWSNQSEKNKGYSSSKNLHVHEIHGTYEKDSEIIAEKLQVIEVVNYEKWEVPNYPHWKLRLQ